MNIPNLCYKLTDQQMRTRVGGANETRWELGVRVSADLSRPPKCCTRGVVHAYSDPLVALLLNPIHANITNPRLFAAEGGGACDDDRGRKLGWQHLTLVAELPVPTITTTQRVAFGVLCGLEVERGGRWREWAERWLSGEDRSRSSASAYAAAATSAAASAATYAAAAYAASAASAYASSAAASAAYADQIDLPMQAAWAVQFGEAQP